MECVVKPLRDVKVIGSKPAGTKNPNGLDAPESRFLKPTGPAQINKQKK
jgi:hypothetical protein